MRLLLIAVLGLLVAAAGCTSSAPTAAQVTKPSAAKDQSIGPSTDAALGADEKVATLASDEPPASQTATEAAVSDATAADRDDGTPIVRETAKPVVGDPAAGIPQVFLSAGHLKLCKINVNDVIPTIELPKLDGGAATLESLAGANATVVVFWTADSWMSATALEDLARLQPPEGVTIVGVAVGVKADAAPDIIAKTGAKFPQLVDAGGTAFAQVGDVALPRVYVFDAQRRIAWFDIEYSEATRRELEQTLAVLTLQ